MRFYNLIFFIFFFLPLPAFSWNEVDCSKISKQTDVLNSNYKPSFCQKYNADVNGSLNKITNVVPNPFSNGIEGIVVHPIKVTLNSKLIGINMFLYF